MPDKNGKLTAQEQAELADLAIALAHNPETRGDVAALVRKAAADKRVAGFVSSFDDVKPATPKTQPEPDPKLKPLTQADLDTRLAEDEGKRRTAREQEAQTAERQTLLESGRFTAESIKKLDEFMEQNGYSNYEHAAIIFAHQNPPTGQRPTIGSKVWTMPAGDVVKDPRKTALNKAYQVVDEIVRARG